MEYLRKNKKFFWIIAIIALCAVIFWPEPDPPPPTEREIAWDVQDDFVSVLIYNDLELAKDIVAPELWPVVVNWTEIHRAVSRDCVHPWDPDFFDLSFGGAIDEDNIASRSFIITRECPEHNISINIKSLSVQKIDGQWLIVEWDEYCEGGINQRCFNKGTLD